MRATHLLGLLASFCIASSVVAGCSGPSDTPFRDPPVYGGTDASGGNTNATGGSGGSGDSGGSSGGTAGNTGGCQSNDECPGNEVCDTGQARCVECLSPADCGDGQTCVANQCEARTGCGDSEDCPSGQVCKIETRVCVECLTNDDCDSGACEDETCVTPSKCTEPADCAESGLLCNVESGECVECLTKGDCASGEDCSGFICVPAPPDCDGTPKVLLLVPRSGAMFELPDPDANWWDSVRSALVEGETPLLEKYSEHLELGAHVFYRETSIEESECPIQLVTPSQASASDLADLFDDAAADHAVATEAMIKIDAPLPEAITSAAGALGTTGRRAIVLVTTSLPDSCTLNDTLCAMDPAVAAVQAARSEGVELYVLGLGANENVTWSSTATPPIGYKGFLSALANAGRGEAVSGPPSVACGKPNQAEYEKSGGNAPFFQALEPESVATELDELFTELLAACDP
jgi:hypothetical protein